MPNYTVVGLLTISVHTRVEANSPEEAIEIARGRDVPGLCHQCSNSERADEEWSTSGELDGEPYDLAIEEG